ncbi:hypothetical protein PFISCL1PPCAC_25882 [Pristionchus fissidentatus]|uniref:Uncharacterized protein n=1 Tax=Pristionchus fissidentatus TaxID=1538716 RepID=A0AAV5WVE6_9BILA|nr:hypothetical protein PFISCL1PPCAC_25882 [Pristionchus fissidentatus]
MTARHLVNVLQETAQVVLRNVLVEPQRVDERRGLECGAFLAALRLHLCHAQQRRPKVAIAQHAKRGGTLHLLLSSRPPSLVAHKHVQHGDTLRAQHRLRGAQSIRPIARSLALQCSARTVHHAAAHAHVRAARRVFPLLVDALAVCLAPGVEGVHAVQVVDELGVFGARARHDRRRGLRARGIRVRADTVRERAVTARAHLEQRADR